MVKILADVHEGGSFIPELLKAKGAEVRMKKLSVADYVISERCAVERKSCRDYVASLFSRRLFDQALRLKEAYEKPVIVVEGDLLSCSPEVNPRALLGSLLSLSVDRGIAVVQTPDSEATAELILTLAKREQEERGGKPAVRAKRRNRELHEEQLFLICGLPGIGRELAERLLEQFKTPRKIFAASKAELRKVEKIGRKKAQGIEKILDAHYKKQERKKTWSWR